MLASTIVSLTLAASALATVFLTEPISTTSWPAGQQVSLTWQDDGNTPALADFGLANFGLYAGNAIQQTLLQTIATNVNVSLTNGVPFNPQASVGPNSGEYFIRVTSLSLNTTGTPSYPVEAFSAFFTLTGMTGQFNSSVQAEIDGQSTAPIGQPTSSGSGSSNSNSPASPTSSKPNPTASPASSSNVSSAAKPVIATGFVAVVAALLGASLF